jgi:hypothetical protein
MPCPWHGGGDMSVKLQHVIDERDVMLTYCGRSSGIVNGPLPEANEYLPMRGGDVAAWYESDILRDAWVCNDCDRACMALQAPKL